MAETLRETSALVAGSTGLVGRECVDLLLGEPSFTRITALVRRSLPKEIAISRLKVEKVDFDHLDARPEVFNAEMIFCALGTTMRQAGSEEMFRRVDFDYPLSIARLGITRGARHFLLVSAAGAGAGSRVFYNRVKGELEDAIAEIGYPSYTIIRPSLLLGDRAEPRPGEKWAGRLGFLAPPRFRPVPAPRVAAALVRAATENLPGEHIIENRDIL